ncbi:MAG: hypothetical protein KDD73_02195 [Anaerolineales bacterium]|nr:hypothetical protein [Anaerolineales bacterium]MCB9127261.1 hypothetical protein [Ardenticatenales bacterium]
MSRYRSASEVGEWHFCHRAWWLHRIEGHESQHYEALDRGNAAHEAHGRGVRLAVRLQRLALLLLLAGLAALCWWGLGL